MKKLMFVLLMSAFATQAWAAPDMMALAKQKNCLACHADLYKDAKGEKNISEVGRLAHDAYLNKNGNTKSNCAGCHINLAHLPEFDQRLEVNAAFKSRLLKEEEKP